MTQRLTVQGTKELNAALERMSEKMQAQVAEVVQETAAGLEAGVKLRMQQSTPTGRTYNRGAISHTASAAGQPPAPDTGVLMGSIYHQMTGPMSAVAGSRVEYSSFLEFGTFKMAKRPAWVPEIEETRPRFLKSIKQILSGGKT